LEEGGFAENLIFSIEAMFHFHGKVNRHNVHIWGTEKPCAAIQHIWDSPKMIAGKVHRPFFLTKSTVNSTSYLDMMQE
jgi:hypothetical protein